MADLEVFTKATVYLKSKLLSLEMDVSIQRLSGAQDVDTVPLGLAGFSPGSPKLQIKCTNGVPSSDFEMDPGQFIVGMEIVDFVCFAAGKTLTTKVLIKEDNFSHAVNSASKLAFDATGKFDKQNGQWT